MITVKKGTIKLEMDRKDLIQIEETHDGVVLNLSNGCHFYVSDQFMPLEAKQLMSTSPGKFLKGNLNIDLSDYRQPVKIDLTENNIKKD